MSEWLVGINISRAICASLPLLPSVARRVRYLFSSTFVAERIVYRDVERYAQIGRQETKMKNESCDLPENHVRCIKR